MERVPEPNEYKSKRAAPPGAHRAGAPMPRSRDWGRSNRTNQKQPPGFRPIATDVKDEKRFLSTIARRLDTLGAITRGQRQTDGQGLFRADDNLESAYAKASQPA
jgi:hypothetical protein